MQTKLGDGSVDVAGYAFKNAEMKTVGEKARKVTSFSLVVGKNKDTTTIYANCKAWGELAEYANKIKKGDAVRAVGTLNEREYNGKIYTDISCVWLNIAETEPRKYEERQTHKFNEAIELSDEELPF